MSNFASGETLKNTEKNSSAKLYGKYCVRQGVLWGKTRIVIPKVSLRTSRVIWILRTGVLRKLFQHACLMSSLRRWNIYLESDTDFLIFLNSCTGWTLKFCSSSSQSYSLQNSTQSNDAREVVARLSGGKETDADNSSAEVAKAESMTVSRVLHAGLTSQCQF